MSDYRTHSYNRRPGRRGRGADVTTRALWVALCFVAALAAQTSAAYASQAAITDVMIQKVGGNCDTAPVTFGQPFKKGDLPRNEHLRGEYSGERLPTQVDVKARNDDGSARHAVITLRVPCAAADSGEPIKLSKGEATPQGDATPDVALSDVIKSDYDSHLQLQIDGERWQINARVLLQQVSRAGGCEKSATFCKRWLKGPLASEWVIGAPLRDASGQPHPHLMAYFAIRAYGPGPVKRIRTDVTVENNWAYAADPQNYQVQPTISVAGRSKPAYESEPFTHYRQARWHHVVWWGDSEVRPLYAKINSQYLQSTAAVPQYARGKLSSKLLNKRQTCPPMQPCEQTPHMEQTGAQAAIGPLPRWSAAFVINPDYRIFRWMLANTDALGGYAFHYRQQDTGEPLSILDHPCATTVWPARQARCKVPPHGDDRFPKCHGNCKSPLNPDIAHHPAPAVAAYVATGDWYYASEMAFMASWVSFWQNPAYRGYIKTLVHRTQTRGQAWSLRTLADAAYLLPDDAQHKKLFNQAVANNIDWYTKNYVNNPDANKLGAVIESMPYSFQGVKRTGVATWQQSFFAWSLGNLVDQRFTGAESVRDWFSRFQIGLMTSPGYCWERASAYNVRIAKKPYADFYETFRDVYEQTSPELVSAGCDPEKLNAAIKRHEGEKNFAYPPGTMVGYPKSPTGFPANFQIGLAADAHSSLPNAREAWNKFASRKIQPDYRSSPQFAVVPSQP